MADNEPGTDDAPLERHLFAAGGDVNDAEAKLLGLLSDEDVAGETMIAAGPEKGDPPAKDDAPGPGEGEQEEEEALEVEDDPPLGDEEPEKDDGPAADEEEEEYEYEYVDADGNVIEDPASEEEAETYTVLVDGKEHEVSLEDLTQSYSFRAHNTQKSQELAKSRSEMDAEAATLRESRDVYGQRLKQVEQALSSSMPQEPDWDTLEVEDPTRFATESAKWARHQRKLDALAAEQKRVSDESIADHTQQLEDFKVDQGKRMMVAIPEWAKDSEVQEAELTRLHAYAQNSMGFTEAEVNTIVDHRAVVALRKAMLYDELLARGRAARKGKKPKGQPTGVLKPGTRRRRVKSGSKRRVAARQRLSQTGSVKDAESLLYDMLGDDA